MLEKYRSIPLTLDLANQYIPNTMVSSGLDAKGRTFDLTITNNGVEADLTDAIVWLAWHHQQVGNSGIRKMEPVDASKGIFTCYLPTNMAHLGTVVASVIVTNDGPDFFLPSLEFKIRIMSAIFDGKEADTCDDFSDLQEAMGNLRNVLNAAIEQLKDQSEFFGILMRKIQAQFDAQMADFEARYQAAEDDRWEQFYHWYEDFLSWREGIDDLVAEIKAKVDQVWNMTVNGITTNPWRLTFTDLDGCELKSGYWNESLSRLEC